MKWNCLQIYKSYDWKCMCGMYANNEIQTSWWKTAERKHALSIFSHCILNNSGFLIQ